MVRVVLALDPTGLSLSHPLSLVRWLTISPVHNSHYLSLSCACSVAQVASEFDALKGSGGRLQRKADRLRAAAEVQRPPPPLVKAAAPGSVTFEWQPEWLGLRLALQSIKVSATSEAEAAALEAASGPSAWTMLHCGCVPRATVALSEPSALYLFRTAVVAENGALDVAGVGVAGSLAGSVAAGDEQASAGPLALPLPDGALLHSAEVFWLSQPAAPTVCGLGRNALASWAVPVLPPSLAASLKAPLPVWRVHTKCEAKAGSKGDGKADSGGGPVRPKSAPPGSEMLIAQPLTARPATPKRASLGLEAEPTDKPFERVTFEDGWTVAVVEPGRSWAVLVGLSVDAVHTVALSAELPAGVSSLGAPASFDSTVAAPTATRDGDALVVTLPRPVDDGGALAAAEQQSGAALATRGVDEWGAAGAWVVVGAARLEAAGTEAAGDAVRVSGLPLNTAAFLRSRCGLDLRRCCRYADGPIHISGKVSGGSAGEGAAGEALAALGLAPRMAFGAATEAPRGSPEYVYAGASLARSRAFRARHARLASASPQSHAVFSDVSRAALACLLPSQLSFDADAADFGPATRPPTRPPTRPATRQAIPPADASERLTVTAPVVRAGAGIATGTAHYCCDVLEASGGGGGGTWRRVYSGRSPALDLCAPSARRLLPPHLTPAPGRCLLLRTGARFADRFGGPEERPTSRGGPRPGTPVSQPQTPTGAPTGGGGGTTAARASARSDAAADSVPTPPPVKWSYSPEVAVVLSPLPPRVEWADDGACAVVVSWDASLDAAALPAPRSATDGFVPLAFALEMASGPLLSPGVGRGPHEVNGPLGGFEEVATAPGSHRLHSGPLAPGSRYAFRVRVDSAHGCARSAPYYVETKPTVPAAPTGLTATEALFRSATGREAPFVQLKWRPPPHQGLPVDKYHLQRRRRRRGGSDDDGGGGSKVGHWSTVYLGPHCATGDKETLVGPLGLPADGDRCEIAYRVRAASLLGWGHWSLPASFSRTPPAAALNVGATAGAATAGSDAFLSGECEAGDMGPGDPWEPCTVQSPSGARRVEVRCTALEATPSDPFLRVQCRDSVLDLGPGDLVAALGSAALARGLVGGLLAANGGKVDGVNADSGESGGDEFGGAHAALVAALAPALRCGASGLALAPPAELQRSHLEARVVARVLAALPFPVNRGLLAGAVRAAVAHLLDGEPQRPIGALEDLAAVVQAAAAREVLGGPAGDPSEGPAVGGRPASRGASRQWKAAGKQRRPSSRPSSRAGSPRPDPRQPGALAVAPDPVDSKRPRTPATTGRQEQERPFTPTLRKPVGMP